jgi:hypothetical protein
MVRHLYTPVHILDRMKLSREVRCQIIRSTGREIMIFRENPIFEYFSDDSRADAVLISDGKIIPVGMKEIDEKFQDENTDDKACGLSPFYEFRGREKCPIDIGSIFTFPTSEEINFIRERKGELKDTITGALSDMANNDTEISVSNRLKSKLCEKGLQPYYDPIVAFDGNIWNIWNKPSDRLPEKVMYVDVSVKTQGISAIFSDTILLTEERKFVEKYEILTAAIDKIRTLFVEGNDTSLLSTELDGLRRKNLYLTTPLFPFGHVPIPGERRTIKSRDTSIFDLWVSEDDVRLRKKVVAIAGSSSATVL